MTISDKIRVYELSRDLKLENKDILDAAQKLSISVKSHSSSISQADAKKITNLLNNKTPAKKILSVSKSSLKAKTEKPKNTDKQNKENKTSSNILHPKKPSTEVLNKKPQLIKPINKTDKSLEISNKKSLNKPKNPTPPTIVSNLQSQENSNPQRQTNKPVKPATYLKDRKNISFSQDKKPSSNSSIPPIKTPAKPPIQLIDKPKNLANSNRNINANKLNNSSNQRPQPSNRIDSNNNFPKKNLNSPRTKNTPELVGAPIRREDPKNNSDSQNSNSRKTSLNAQISANRPSIPNRQANSNRSGGQNKQSSPNRPEIGRASCRERV